MLNEQIKLPLDTKDLSINNYNTPFCASCPMCGAFNSLIIREDNEDRNNIIQIIVCDSCHMGGTASDWEEALNAEESVPNKHKDISNIYIESLRNFTTNYYMAEKFMNSLGYYSPDPPPGNAFSIFTEEQVEELFEKLGEKKKMVKRYHYIAIPAYKHPGLIERIIIYDGVRFFSYGGGSRYCYSGTLSTATVEDIFVVDSLKDLIRTLSKQAIEKIPAQHFTVIADVSNKNFDDTSTFSNGRIRASRIILLKKTAVKEPLLYTPKNLAGAPYFIEKYEKYAISKIVTNASMLARQIDVMQNDLRRLRWKEVVKLHRFIVNTDSVSLAEYVYSKQKNRRDNPQISVISGLLYVEKDGEDTYSITVRKNTKARVVTFEKVHVSVFQDKDTFNSYIEMCCKKEELREFPLLLEWFGTKAILPNLLIISEQTAEVLKRRNKNADQD